MRVSLILCSCVLLFLATIVPLIPGNFSTCIDFRHTGDSCMDDLATGTLTSQSLDQRFQPWSCRDPAVTPPASNYVQLRAEATSVSSIGSSILGH